MTEQNKYDVAIVGGGLAGLAVAILLAKQQHKVILFEKEVYPFHKVCGEYISLESYDFLVSLGLPLSSMELPVVKRIQLSAPSGKSFIQPLPLGGIGISRYLIDNELAKIARNAGVVLMEKTKVNDIIFGEYESAVLTDAEEIRARVVCGAFGKRSNLDIKWKRPFVTNRPGVLNNFIAVKYHVQLDHPKDIIGLHNFSDGYCGIQSIEENKTCMCYLTTAGNLKKSGNSIQRMEEEIICRNPFLRTSFKEMKNLYDSPLVISQISFEKKEQVENGVLLLGDSAGLITPLCGNGMSMALHSSKIASKLIDAFLKNQITREVLQSEYKNLWKKQFRRRLQAGRYIQALFGNDRVTNATVSLLQYFPSLTAMIIRQTHG